jgi:LacI family transcriptional regulator
MKKKTSIVDIAKCLNISPTTVSFILNGRAKEKRISDQVVERVQKYINEVGYKPNTLARSLRTGKTNTIGLLVESIANPFFANIARGIEELAYKSGYKILYSSTENDTEKTKELIQLFRERHIDGYIISPPEGIEEEINALIKSGSPVVLFDRDLASVKTDTISIDNLASTYGAVKHLIESGYKNIGFVTLDSSQSQMVDRLSGYEKAIDESGLATFVKKISYQEAPENIVSLIISFLKENELDAVIFATNYFGISGLKAINELKLKVPEDIAVISFDDHDLFELYTPPITCISQPIEEIANQLITILLDKLKAGAAQEKELHIIPTNLKVRKSSLAV